MTKDKTIFWNVDTQYDFINPKGELYVQDAEKIIPNLKIITEFANRNNIQIINTSDYHLETDTELSQKPDFINTFPPHCMKGSLGAEFIAETKPIENTIEVLYDRIYKTEEIIKISKHRNIIIRKNKFDVFTGNKNTTSIVNIIKPKYVYIYGLTSNVCVNCAVVGLAKLNIKVIVIEDAIKELANIKIPFDHWDTLGVKRIFLRDIMI